jgi:hypothetical protein
MGAPITDLQERSRSKSFHNHPFEYFSFYRSMGRFLFYFLLLLGVLLIFYLSWLANPNMEQVQIIPKWLSQWADVKKNGTIRTGVPFLILGVLVGSRLKYIKSTSKNWINLWFVLLAVVLTAELGQLLLPRRSFDPNDVFWGAIGSGVGMLPFYFMLRLFAKNQNTSKSN